MNGRASVTPSVQPTQMNNATLSATPAPYGTASKWTALKPIQKPTIGRMPLASTAEHVIRPSRAVVTTAMLIHTTGIRATSPAAFGPIIRPTTTAAPTTLTTATTLSTTSNQPRRPALPDTSPRSGTDI